MSLTRNMLKAMGLEAEKIDEVIAAHTDTVNALKDQIDTAKAEAEKYKAEAAKGQTAQKELDELKKQVEADAEKRKGKDYDALKKEFDEYKLEQERMAVRGQKESAYRKLLKDAGIPEKHHDKIIKYSDVDGVELDEKGAITTAKDLMREIKTEWADHIETTNAQGAQTPTPPTNGGGKGMTKEDILSIKDRSERQKAISENHELFGY